ncbi:carbonic anhydrase [Thermoleptolyngbya sichuanensis A183]|uniref:Carbonic anhydrase n=1 Tax=Thermoleptolyngbya sichuanensis A183 TaxID=2737172 RepID=A0A6M8BC31_9CYAN|nr:MULTISPECIES: carbonic anhydrase [Thermoleptolyngbya]QKD81880.1 carbonic anhydrase [Thermoleptolyngbya sichuanensis A183]
MKELIKGLREFKKSFYCTHIDLYEELAQGQHPMALIVCCADSRVGPELLTNAEPGEIFVIRNAGNIIPPYGATNGGEGASIEYAVEALGIRDIVICGHSHCGAMKGLLKLNTLEEKMPLVYNWLKHAEATRLLIKENYTHLEGEELLNATIAENVLTQIENLKTYPSIHSKLYDGTLKIYAWIYDMDRGEVWAYDAEKHAYIPPHAQLPEDELDPDLLTDAPITCEIPAGSAASAASSKSSSTNTSNTWYVNSASSSSGNSDGSSAGALNGNGASNGTGAGNGASKGVTSAPPAASETSSSGASRGAHWFPRTRLSPEQQDRIYRGSGSR